MRKARLLAVALGALGVAACNQVFGIENGALVAADSDADADTDSSVDTDSGSSSPDAGPRSTKLYPLGLGYTWTYDVVPTGTGTAACAAGLHDVTVSAGPTTLDGKQAYDIGVLCVSGGAQTVAPDPKNDTVYIHNDNKWLVLLEGALIEGQSWQYDPPLAFSTFTFTWHRETSVTVPAGTFTDCWTATQTAVSYPGDNFNTYCRGFGLVESYASDPQGTGYDAKLTKTNF